MATSEVVTPEILRAEFAALRCELCAEFRQHRADMYRAFWIQGAAIVAILGVIVGVATALD